MQFTMTVASLLALGLSLWWTWGADFAAPPNAWHRGIAGNYYCIAVIVLGLVWPGCRLWTLSHRVECF
jgi:hypothetical protein